MFLAPASAASVAAPLATPSIKDIVSQVLINSINAVKSGAEWIKGQIPDVLSQFLHWQLAYHAIWCVVILAAIVFCIWVIMTISADDEKANEDPQRHKSNPQDNGGVICFFAILVLVFSGFFMYNMFYVVEIWLAPKVFLLEYAASLVRN